jgi:hypothetical protein
MLLRRALRARPGAKTTTTTTTVAWLLWLLCLHGLASARRMHHELGGTVALRGSLQVMVQDRGDGSSAYKYTLVLPTGVQAGSTSQEPARSVAPGLLQVQHRQLPMPAP